MQGLQYSTSVISGALFYRAVEGLLAQLMEVPDIQLPDLRGKDM